jgi:glycine cleavage system aminomethyltransferase T
VPVKARSAASKSAAVRPGGRTTAEIGFSAGRVESVTYQRMISLGFIARSHASLGTEVAVVWGNPGTRQKRIRATVARFPYLLGERNDAIDVRAPRG